jgi:hypothetical protein
MLLNDEDSDLDFEDNNLREHGFFILDDEFPSEEDIDSDEDEELDEDELNGIMNEEKIKQFNDILFKAQAMALKAEHEARSTYLIYHPSAMQTMHQRLRSRPDRSGGSVGKPQISWPSHTATRYDFKTKKGA